MERDVIVVGGGPVGVAAARACRALSVALLVREPHVPPPSADAAAFDARVYALSPGNMAFLESIGAAPRAHTPVHAMRVFGDRGAKIEFDAYRAGVPALAWIVEDRVLQEALWHEVSAIALPQRDEIVVDDEGVRVQVAEGRMLSGKLLVAADGANSAIRTRAGVGVREHDYGQSAVVANFACERDHANTAFQWFQAGPVLALLPLPGNHVSMVWSLPQAAAARIAALAPEELCREVESASQGILGHVTLVTPPRTFALRRLAARRLIAPRIALAGDAAHVIHPLAGQGLNLGLQDVRALIKVLESREPGRDPGDLRLLRRYERARAEPVLAMDFMVNGLYALFGANVRPAAGVRNAALNLADRIPVLKNLLVRHAMN